MNDQPTSQRVNEITGTFVLVILAVLIAVVVWTGRSQRWFKSRVTLRITLPADGAAGIRQGSEVYLLGTLVGSVADVLVDESGRMEAVAQIRRDYFRFVRVDSSAVVKMKFGVAGDSYFEISRGQSRALPEDHASIVCKEQFQGPLEAAVEQVRRETLVVFEKTTARLDTWTRLGADLGETRQRVDQLVVRLENMAAGVEQGKGTAGKLLNDTRLADETQKFLTRANAAMGELQAVVTNLNRAVDNVQTGTPRLPEITEAGANEPRELPGLVLQTQTAMRELDRLIEAAQRHWLLRKYVNSTNPAPLKPMPATGKQGTQPREALIAGKFRP